MTDGNIEWEGQQQTLSKACCRPGNDVLDANWGGDLYSNTQHRPLQQRHSKFLADQSPDVQAEPDNAPQRTPHAQHDTPSARAGDASAPFDPPTADPIITEGERSEAGQEENGHRALQLQAEGVGGIEDIGIGGSEAEASNGVQPAAPQRDRQLVRVAHLGEGAFLNEHPLLVRVTPSIFDGPVSCGGSAQLRHRRLQPSPEQQRQSRLERGESAAGPQRTGAESETIRPFDMVLSHEQYRCCCAVLLDGGIGLVPSAAFLQSWNRHTTLHIRRLQAPPDESDADSDADSGDGSSSQSSMSSGAEADGSCGAAADGDAAEKGVCSGGKGQEDMQQEDGVGSKDDGRSFKKRAFSKTPKRKRLRRGMLRGTSTPVMSHEHTQLLPLGCQIRPFGYLDSFCCRRSMQCDYPQKKESRSSHLRCN